MPADRLITSEGAVMWVIYGEGMHAIIPDAMYQGIQNNADKIRQALHELGHREIGVWDSIILHRPIVKQPVQWVGIDWATEPDRAATTLVFPRPWLLPDGQPPGARHIILPAPHPRRVIAIFINRIIKGTHHA